MIEWWKLYSRKDPPCKYCVQAKELLDLYGIDYKEFDLEDPGVRQMFSEQGYRTVPQIFKEDVYIGGLVALQHYLERERLDKELEYKKKGGKDVYHSA